MLIHNSMTMLTETLRIIAMYVASLSTTIKALPISLTFMHAGGKAIGLCVISMEIATL